MLRSRNLVTNLLKAAALSSFLISSAGTAQSAEHVVIGSSSPWVPYQTGLIFGLKLGFFEEENIEPEFASVQGSAVMVPQIANKTITFGWPTPDLPLIALSKSEPFPITFFYNHSTTQAFEVAVLEDSPIKSIADLKGKSLGVGALGWGNIPMTRAILADANIKWMEDVNIVPVGIGPQAWGRLTSGEVDALNLFVHQHELITLSGHPVRRLALPEKFANIFSNGWATHNDTIKDKPKLVAAFGRIVAKSTYACSVAPRACAKAFWDYDMTARPAPDAEEAWIEENASLIEADKRITFGKVQDMNKLGFYPSVGWTNFVSALQIGGQIEEKAINVEALYTNEFIEQFNNFDREEVKRLAEAAE